MYDYKPRLWAIAYHYVRDLPRSRYPRIKGLLTEQFRRQVAILGERFEMATLESALALLTGEYHPARDLCLLTFDDGLKDHYTDVLPVLAERRIQGLFFLITACLEEGRVAAVHKNHFLMAALGFEEYRSAFLQQLARISPQTSSQVDERQANQNYRFDTPEVAAFKFLMNFRLGRNLREQIVDALFRKYLGDERQFSEQLYLNWSEARQMQDQGMLIGGHSHRHLALATLEEAAQQEDLETSTALLRQRLSAQRQWPFSYPYGQPQDSFNDSTIRTISQLGFSCAFTTEAGTNTRGQERFQLRRLDTNDIAN